MPTDLPERKSAVDPAGRGRIFSGRIAVILIVAWVAILLVVASIAIRRLKSDPCWDRGPGSAPVPAECTAHPTPHARAPAGTVRFPA